MARLINEGLTPDNMESILRPEIEYNFNGFEDFPDVRDNYILDQSGVGYPKRIIFMGTNTSELYIDNTENLNNSIVFFPQENVFRIYKNGNDYTEIKLLTDENKELNGVQIDGTKHNNRNIDDNSRMNLGQVPYSTRPDNLENLV